MGIEKKTPPVTGGISERPSRTAFTTNNDSRRFPPLTSSLLVHSIEILSFLKHSKMKSSGPSSQHGASTTGAVPEAGPTSRRPAAKRTLNSSEEGPSADGGQDQKRRRRVFSCLSCQVGTSYLYSRVEQTPRLLLCSGSMQPSNYLLTDFVCKEVEMSLRVRTWKLWMPPLPNFEVRPGFCMFHLQIP